MMGVTLIERQIRHPARPEARGYHAAYRRDETNRCPGCGRAHWYVGRITAECSFCGTAVPLAETTVIGIGCFRVPAFEEAA